MPRIVDACCTINLFAAGDLRALLSPLSDEWYIPPKVRDEAQTIRRPAPDDPTRLVPEKIDWQPVLEAGVLRLCEPTDKELALFVEIAANLDDGESICLAIAQSRKWTVATDDRKARRVAGERGVEVITTAEIIKCWADATSADDTMVADVLWNIQTFARFPPSRTMPLYSWWVEMVKRRSAM